MHGTMYKIILALCLFTISAEAQQIPDLVPQPVELRMGAGKFLLSADTRLETTSDPELFRLAQAFNSYILDRYGFALRFAPAGQKGNIRFIIRKFIKAPDKDGSTVRIDANSIHVEGDTYPGIFYALQTIFQLLPDPPPPPPPTIVKVKEKPGKKKVKAVQPKTHPEASGPKLVLPCLVINDYPRFAYRGLHLDVCRHFFPVSFIKTYIDILAAHKLNTFHWHLTDDQGWRIEIRQFPELTNTGGWRHGTITSRYPGTGNDNQRYGGFYTQAEVREVVAYARDRYITIIPEIEMPGHAAAAIASYPFLSCFPSEPTQIATWPSEGSKAAQAAGKPKQVQETWGVIYDIMCAGKDSTFHFLEGVLGEVIALFPGKYIHIGGDEAPKSNWKRCPQCQARMQSEGLKNEHELQSYFIRRVERFVNSKGRNIIGWDEILEGGLAPNAAVMSWQGQRGGAEAAKQKHEVVMTPQQPCYFDHAQVKPEDSLVWGGYNPLDSVYSFEAVPRGLDSISAGYILGGQANMWTEYMATPSKVEYMLLPRLAALSEALWTPKESRNWNAFEQKLPAIFKWYDRRAWNASRAYYYLKPDLRPDTVNGGMTLQFTTKMQGARITYITTSDDSKSNIYVSSLHIPGVDPVGKKTGTHQFTVSLTAPGGSIIQSIPFIYKFSKSTAKRITLVTAPSRNYPGLGAFSLVNGTWSEKGLANADWLGFLGNDIDATIDLGNTDTVSSVALHTLDQNGSWIYLPQSVEIQLSQDGLNFSSVGSSTEFVKDSPLMTQGWITVQFAQTTARYIRVFAKNFGVIPEGMPGAGTKAWLFGDEIRVK
jgi:hexosaminidase